MKVREKAWIIRAVINACNDMLKSFYPRRTVPLDALLEQPALLPPDNKRCWKRFYPFRPNIKYKDVVSLHFYQDYTAPDEQDLGQECPSSSAPNRSGGRS